MTKKILVKKQSGEKQPFSAKKLTDSLQRAGTPPDIAHWVVGEIIPKLHDGIPTKTIYRMAFGLLRRKMRALAARYSLKSAIMELGPTGYPFEKFVGEIFRKRGFSAETGITMEGKCVFHEVDVKATKNLLTILVECKYRNEPSKISGVQVPLYVNSRFLDIVAKLRELHPESNQHFEGWIVTNTRFSSDAEAFGTCAGLHLVSWSFPEKENLRELVERYALFPVTALTSLTKKQKQQLLEKGIILADHVVQQREVLKILRITTKKEQSVFEEASTLSAIGKIL